MGHHEGNQIPNIPVTLSCNVIAGALILSIERKYHQFRTVTCYNTKGTKSVCLSVCLSVRTVTWWVQLLTPAGQTVCRGGLKFAHCRDDVTGMRPCRVCGRWGAGLARGTRWKNVNFPDALTWGILRSERTETAN